MRVTAGDSEGPLITLIMDAFVLCNLRTCGKDEMYRKVEKVEEV
jgi:hypothetical protein